MLDGSNRTGHSLPWGQWAGRSGDGGRLHWSFINPLAGREREQREQEEQSTDDHLVGSARRGVVSRALRSRPINPRLIRR
jgi:hypothetical protein